MAAKGQQYNNINNENNEIIYDMLFKIFYIFSELYTQKIPSQLIYSLETRFIMRITPEITAIIRRLIPPNNSACITIKPG